MFSKISDIKRDCVFTLPECIRIKQIGSPNIMWSQFFIAYAACAVILISPGYLAARTVKLARPLALAAAPAITCALLGIWSYIAWKMGVFATGATIFLPVLILCAATFALGAIIRRFATKKTEHIGTTSLSKAPICWKTLAAFLGMGIIVTGFMLVKSLDGPGSFIQSFDNMSHLMRIEAFVQTGVFSPVGVDMDYNLPDPPIGGHTTGFYPCSWHCIAATLVSIFNISITIAENVVNCVFISLVVPIGAWAFSLVVFKDRMGIAICALLTLAFASFPWRMLTWGPLFPNMAAYAMILGTTACFFVLFSQGQKASHRIALSIVGLACIAGLGLSHPNAVFALGILLAPYICWRILGIENKKGKHSRKSKMRWVILVLFLLASIALWFALLNSSFLSSIVNYNWPASMSPLRAAAHLFSLALHMTPIQPVLALLVIIGALNTFKNRSELWITIALSITCIMYIVNMSTDGTLKTILTGFWYQDPCRISGMVAIFSYPLACLGINTVLQAVKKGIAKLSKNNHSKLPVFASALTCLVLFIAIFMPNFNAPVLGDVETGLGQQRMLLCHLNNSSRNDDYLGADEREFLDKVKQIVPNDAVIINHPYDGSSYAAAPMDLNVYWRYWGGYHGNTDDAYSQLIRHNMDKVATDPDVQDAVKAVKAEYLLLLDQGTVTNKKNLTWIPSYQSEDWDGIEAINNNTPGLELILSEGDMRLYRITAIEDR